MTMTTTAAPELLRIESILPILRSPGPCITILLPAYHPGEPSSSPSAFLKSNMRDIARQLTELELTEFERVDLMQPLERLAATPELSSGSHWGRAIFRSPTVFNEFPLVQPVQANLTIGGSFAIRKLALELACPATFYILAISQKKVSLMRCAGLDLEVAPLPPGVPPTLAEMLALDVPDHDLENRSSSGRGTGSMRSVRFGTGSGSEQEQRHVADYYKLVDRGLQSLHWEAGTPLILVGVDEDTALYKAHSSYRALVKTSIPGNMDEIRDTPQLLRQAWTILRAEVTERHAEAFASARERFAPARFETDPDAILEAAFNGRVDQLYLNDSLELTGATAGPNYQAWGNEDLLNLAVVQTLIHHGKSCELPASRMPAGMRAAAILRY